MSVPLSTLTVPVFVRCLTILSTLFAKGAEHAAQAGIKSAGLAAVRPSVARQWTSIEPDRDLPVLAPG
jgi:hypothetical protein